MPPRGRAGFFCQSGALGSAILEKVTSRGLGLSTFVSAGNRADVSGNDLLQYWEEDDTTEVVLLYLESIGNPRKFSRIARRVSRRKPIIAVKSGRTTQGVPMGHAVRQIAARRRPVDAMFRQAGVIQVDTLDEMFDVAQLLAHQPLPRGRRVAIVGNSDALGLLAADAAAAVGPRSSTSRWRSGADATAEDFEDALDAAIDDPEVDAVVAVFIPPLNVSGDEVANVLAAVGEQSDKPLVSIVPRRRGGPRAAAGPRRRRAAPPAAARCRRTPPSRRRSARWPASWSTPCGCAPPTGGRSTPGEVDPAAAKRLVNRVLDASTATARDLTDDELRRAARRPTASSSGSACRSPPRTRRWRPASARLGRRAQGDRRPPAPAPGPGPRVAQHRHRGGDARRVADPQRADPTPDDGRLRGPAERAARGAGRDPRHRGPAVRAGGLVRRLRAAHRAARRTGPTGSRRCMAADAAAMVREIKAAPLLFGYRGSEPVDIDRGRAAAPAGRPAEERPARRSARSTCSLVLAGADGVNGAHRAGRVEPVLDPRSDWFVRRLPRTAGRHAARTERPGRARDRLPHMRTTARRDHDRTVDLRAAIEPTGYYPEVVARRGVRRGRRGSRWRRNYVHHEPTFERDEVRRHVTVLVLTPSRLILAHTDEHAAATTCCPRPTPRPRRRRSP